VRDHLDRSGWDREPPAPPLPPEVVDGTRARYVEAYERLTAESFERYRERTGATTLDDDPVLERLREERG
jgi:phosphoribosylaminoimidazole-succinocarboxamide synthase